MPKATISDKFFPVEFESGNKNSELVVPVYKQKKLKSAKKSVFNRFLISVGKQCAPRTS